jgi:predicted nuclease with TOPRIM domain
MSDTNHKEITNWELLESINRSFSRLEDRMSGMATKEDLERFATKDDLLRTELRLQTQINDVQTDIRSFKQETSKNFKEINEKFDDLHDTVMNHDTRIERLETKVFA